MGVESAAMSWRHRTIAQEQEVIALSRHHPQRTIAKLTGLHQTTVLEIQRKYHLVLSFGQSVSSAGVRYAYDEVGWGRVIEYLYIDCHLPLREVARRCGVDIGTVRRRMDHLGIPCRSAGESNRGRKRKPYRSKLARCARCGGGVRSAGEMLCATCRRRVAA